MKKLICYHSDVMLYGGIERFEEIFLSQIKEYYDTVFMYSTIDYIRLQKLQQIVPCVQYKSQSLECDILLLISAWGVSPINTINFKVAIQMIHADLSSYALSGIFRLQPDKRINAFVSVSQRARESLLEQHNIDSTVIYNLLDNVKPLPKTKNKILKFVTVSRLGKEKGIQRCIDFAKLIPFDYEWDIYGLGMKFDAKGTNINFKGYIDNPKQVIAAADYLVQLSDCEGWCYSINEALQQRTPVLLTPFPSGYEQVQDGINGYRVPFKVVEFDHFKLLNIPKVKTAIKQKSTINDWLKFFSLNLNKIIVMKVEIIKQNSSFPIGTIVELEESRAKSAIERGLAVEVKTKKAKK